MKRIKVFPNKNSIDNILQDVEDDINKIQEEARFKIDSVIAAVDIDTKRKGSISLNQTERDTEKNKEYIEDDVKFSHEVARDAKNHELTVQKNVLAQQLQEYKKQYQQSVEKLRESDIKNSELESKFEQVEDENATLKRELGNRRNAAVNRPAPQGGSGNEKLNSELQKRTDEIRNALLNDAEDGENTSFDSLLTGSNRFEAFLKWFLQYAPFKRDIKVIQARFGSAVASYFIFYRFVFFLTAALGVMLLAFGALHVVEMSKSTSNPLRFIVSNSFLPNLMIFSSYHSNENVIYSAMISMGLLMVLVFLCRKLVEDDKQMKTLEAFESINNSPFANNILCAWDCSLSNKLEVEDFKSDLTNRLLQQLEERDSLGLKKLRTQYEWFVVIFRRVSGVCLYLAVTLAAFGLIIYFTINSKAIANQIPSLPGIGSIGSLISPFVLEAINTATPMLFQLITQLEMWDSRQTEVNLVLFRMYLSNTLNIFLLATTYLLLADPLLLASYPQLRASLELPLNSSYTCRIDQVADALFSLMMLTWLFRVVFIVLNPFLDYFLAVIIKKTVWVKAEFSVAQQMVKLLSYLGIIFITFPFAPLSIVFVPITTFISIKWEKFWIKRLYSKPKRPWKAHKAAFIYSVFFLTTFALVGVTICGYFMYTRTLAKSCDIQDEYVHLCLYGYLNEGDDKCTTDSSSKYYALYGSDNYPAVICNSACGPFVKVASPVDAFIEYANSSVIVEVIWSAMFRYPYLPWGVIVVLFLVVSFHINTIFVLRFTAFNKENSLEQQIRGILVEKKRQEAMIDKLKKMVIVPMGAESTNIGQKEISKGTNNSINDNKKDVVDMKPAPSAWGDNHEKDNSDANNNESDAVTDTEREISISFR